MSQILIVLLLMVLGAASWTLAEYMLHRFWGHMVPKGLFYREHTRHHFKKDYFASWVDKLMMVVTVSALLGSTSVWLMGWLYGLTYLVSFLSMYLYYEHFHAYIHFNGPTNKYAAKMASHHFYHHYIDETQNHGVTTDFWDKVFRTYVKVKDMDIPVPQKFAMNWIDKQEIGDVFSDGYFVTYTIVKKHNPTKYNFSKVRV
jgi:sterol desaturase/sphingolipid hydroxylase (fatty acid hydroxylase superfamily)